MLIFLTTTPQLISAHQPFTLCIENNSSAKTINIIDGSVSHAIYWSFTNTNQSFAIDINTYVNEILQVGLLIENLDPENEISRENLPYITIPSLDLRLEPEIRTSFYEPYSQKDYIRILRYTSSKFQETQKITVEVHARSTGAFVFSLGYKEEFGSVYIKGDMRQRSINGNSSCLIAPNIRKITTTMQDKDALNILPITESQKKSVTQIEYNQNDPIAQKEINVKNSMIYLIPIISIMLIGICILILQKIKR
ncbi:MAG: hypothetical protein DK305_000994 [Chloroflexi bacterium]|nr:MAG: hypothetical protein DK305_000994 [Chloroflexota bacterium]